VGEDEEEEEPTSDPSPREGEEEDVLGEEEEPTPDPSPREGDGAALCVECGLGLEGFDACFLWGRGAEDSNSSSGNNDGILSDM